MIIFRLETFIILHATCVISGFHRGASEPRNIAEEQRLQAIGHKI
jgi:hypothetical protein